MEIFVHPTCTSCRKAETLLRAQGVEFARRDYFKNRFTEAELRDVLARAGLTAHDVLSTRAKAYKALGLNERTVTEDELIQLMVAEPTLIRRPLVIGRGGTAIGFNERRLTELANAEKS